MAAGELVDAVLAASDRLVAAAERLHDVAIGQPSLLPNWTVGHVLSHVALNAEAFVRVAEELSGFTPTAWSEPYVAADLPTQWATVAQRCEDALRVRDETGTMWEIGEGAALVELDRRTLLAWLLDRASVSSLPDLVSWGDQSRWRPDARS